MGSPEKGFQHSPFVQNSANLSYSQSGQRLRYLFTEIQKVPGNPIPKELVFDLLQDNHPNFASNDRVVELFLEYSPKMLAVILLIMDQTLLAKEKSILWFAYPLIQSIAHEILNMLGIQHEQLLATQPMSERQKIVNQFNKPSDETMHLLASMKVGGTGINLQKACRNCIIVDSCESFSQFIQVRGRTYRIGQKEISRVYTLVVPGTADVATIRYVLLGESPKGFSTPPFYLTQR